MNKEFSDIFLNNPEETDFLVRILFLSISNRILYTITKYFHAA